MGDPRSLNYYSLDGHDKYVSLEGELDPEYFDSAFSNSNLYRDGFILERHQAKVGGGNISGSQNFLEDPTLFELPRQPLLSIAQLQHVYINGRAPYQIGNSWGSSGGASWNQLFDRYFFSGLSRGVSQPDIYSGEPLPNVRLIAKDPSDSVGFTMDDVVNDLQGYSSQYLMVNGSFNVNSTSAQAWHALLLSAYANNVWNYVNLRKTRGDQSSRPYFNVANLREAFFRFSQSIQETYEFNPIDIPSNSPGGWEAHPDTSVYRRGMKDLSNGVTSLITPLATQIVTNVRRRLQTAGEPFLSMDDFLRPDTNGIFNDNTIEDPNVNISLIEDAIAAVGGINQIDDVDGVPIPHRSPAFLSQADIMTALDPVVSVRSDTFRIRSKGEYVDPITGEVTGSAWCEAFVQRIPDPVDAGDSITKPTYALGGRQFKILSFKWLKASDI